MINLTAFDLRNLIKSFSAGEWKRVKYFTTEDTLKTFTSAFDRFYGVKYSRNDIILLLRRFQFESRLALSYPEVKNLMYVWLGFKVKLVPNSSKKSLHAKSFYNFIPVKIVTYDKN